MSFHGGLVAPTTNGTHPEGHRREESSERASGGGGIRTHGGLPHTRFPSVPIRPLSHPSRERLRVSGGSLLSTRRSGPVQRLPVNRVRVGRQQLSAGRDVCRRSSDRR